MSSDLLDTDYDPHGTVILLTHAANGCYLTIMGKDDENGNPEGYAYYCLTRKSAKDIAQALLGWVEHDELIHGV